MKMKNKQPKKVLVKQASIGSIESNSKKEGSPKGRDDSEGRDEIADLITPDVDKVVPIRSRSRKMGRPMNGNVDLDSRMN